MSTADRILDEARSWIGTPYRKAGRTRRRGTDCLNYVGLSYLNAGILSCLPEHRDYGYGFWRKPGDTIQDAIDEGMSALLGGFSCDMFINLPRELWLPADLLCMTRFKNLNKVTHTALVEKVEPHAVTILHCRQGRGGKVERTQLDPSWRILRSYRIEG